MADRKPLVLVSGQLRELPSGDMLDGITWTTYSPTVAAAAGAFTSASATGRYCRLGKLILFTVAVTITTNGTASSYWTVTIPFTAANLGYNQPVVGKETNVVGVMALGNILNNTFSMAVVKYDNTYLGGDGYKIVFSGSYEAA